MSGLGRRKLAMIGLDAADLEFIQEHLFALPNLARLLSGGTVRRLDSTAGLLAGSVWPTFYTGTLPGEHGIYHHLQWDAAAMGLRRVSADWLHREPFWYELERRGLLVIAVDVPMTFPSRLTRGVEVINWGSHDTLSAFQTQPAELRGEILRRFGRHPMGCEIPVNKSAGELERIRANLVEGARRKGELSRWLAETRPWDFFLTVFGECHRGGHILWAEKEDEGEPGAAGALRDVYRAVDEAIGVLLASPALAEARVAVFALHGMGPNRSQEHFMPRILDQINARFGSSAVAEEKEAPPKGQRSVMRLLREKVPAAWQNAVAKAVPVSVRDFVVSRSVTSGHEWKETPGFALLADLHGYVRLNLAGRERLGSLSRASDEERQYREWIEQTLLSFRIAGSGERLVREVVWTRDVFPGERSEYLPDAIVKWSGAGPVSRIESEILGRIEAQRGTGRSGNHRADGFFLAGDGEASARPPSHISGFAGWALDALGVSPAGDASTRGAGAKAPTF